MNHETENASDKSFQRAVVDYKNYSDPFTISSHDYSHQFAHIYTLRLNKLRANLTEHALEKWGTDVPVLQLFQLTEQDAKVSRCIVIGTLYKQQNLKPCILREISEEHQLDPQPPRTQFTDKSDELLLEDELQRITLRGKIDPQIFVTGVVCAVLGRDNREGKFHVEDYCFARPTERVFKPLDQPASFVVLVSGLALGSAHGAESLLGAELLADWLIGQAGSECDQEKLSRVVRVVLAGNSLQESQDGRLNPRKLRNVDSDTQKSLMESVEKLDNFISQIVSNLDLDLMPGEFDPANHMLPQQPLHHCLLPEAFRYPTFHSVSNPYQCEVAGRLLLGTSGQPLKDLDSLCCQEDRLHLLESCLQWSHLAPTCPDTLPCFPCYKEDPFIIEKCPDVLFAGNQPEFQTKMHKASGGQPVRLICIPSFSLTQSCVLLNLNTLDCEAVNFGIPLNPDKS